MVELHMEPGRPRIVGTDGDDTIFGMNNSDERIEGGEGNDVLHGWFSVWLQSYGNYGYNPDAVDRNDTILGGGGNDYIRVGGEHHVVDRRQYSSRDLALGGSGDDTILGWWGDDHLHGESGDDWIRSDIGIDWVYGGTGNDTLVLGESGNAFGGSGDDRLDIARGSGFGGNGNDLILAGVQIATEGHRTASANGGSGADTLVGTEAGERLSGGAGDDAIWLDYQVNYQDGRIYLDVAHGDGGNDTIHGGWGREYIYGGTGHDLIHADSTERVGPTPITNEMRDYIEGGSGNDTIIGGIGGDRISGGEGRDSIVAVHDNSTVDGDAGNDLIRVGGNSVARGGTGADTITALGDDSYLAGNDGDDVLSDDSTGAVTMSGHRGADELIFRGGDGVGEGGAGADIFSMAGAGWTSHVVITDFTIGEDVIRLNRSYGADSFFASAVQDGDDVLVNMHARGTLVLENVLLSDLTADSLIW